MNYYRIYDAIMKRAVGRELDGYCERHHIQPRSLGGDNEKSNIIKLTYREHFLAHWLLTKFTTGVARWKMLCALSQMARRFSKNRIISSWQYEIVRRAHIEKIKGREKSPEWRAKLSAALLGRKFSQERCKNISLSLTGRIGSPNPMKGKKRPPEFGINQSIKMKGRKRAPEHCAKLSLVQKGKIISIETRSKISKTLMGRKRPDISVMKKGKKNPEHSRKMKKYWEKRHNEDMRV